MEQERLKELLEETNFDKTSIDLSAYIEPTSLSEHIIRVKENNNTAQYYENNIINSFILNLSEKLIDKRIFTEHLVVSYGFTKWYKNEAIIVFVNKTIKDLLEYEKENLMIYCVFELRDNHINKYLKKGGYPITNLQDVHFHILMADPAKSNLKIWDNIINLNKPILKESATLKGTYALTKMLTKDHEKNSINYVNERLSELYGLINLYFPYPKLNITYYQGNADVVKIYKENITQFKLYLTNIDEKTQHESFN